MIFAPTAPATANRTSRFRAISLTDAAAAMLAIAGALVVVAGAYTPWATFYAGLVERNGVSGHGKYFIALAVVAVLATALSHVRSMRGVGALAPLAGIAIAATAIRDLRNMQSLTHDPAAAFYVPAVGDGLYIVIAGAALLVASFLIAPRLPLRSGSAILPTFTAVAVSLAAGALVAGAYGEYYLHLAGGHHHEGHTDPLNIAHVLTVSGISLLVIASSAATYSIGSRRRAR